jgi:hypothetical protein
MGLHQALEHGITYYTLEFMLCEPQPIAHSLFCTSSLKQMISMAEAWQERADVEQLITRERIAYARNKIICPTDLYAVYVAFLQQLPFGTLPDHGLFTGVFDNAIDCFNELEERANVLCRRAARGSKYLMQVDFGEAEDSLLYPQIDVVRAPR